MMQTFTCLKICTVFFLLHERIVTLGHKLRVQRDDTSSSVFTRQSDETPLFTRSEPTISSSRWQVGRVSRKQYEVINMIWRRTNIFVDVDNIPKTESTTMKRSQNVRSVNDLNKSEDMNLQHTQKLVMNSRFQHSTPSYIEFFYLEEITNGENVDIQPRPLSTLKFEKYIIPNDKSNKPLIGEMPFSRSPHLLFQLFDSPNQKRNNKSAKRNPRKNDKKENSDLSIKSLSKIVVQSYKDDRIFNEKTFVENDNVDVMSTVRISMNMLSPIEVSSKVVTKASSNVTNITTEKNYDRVKFFDIYDSDTEEPLPSKMNLDYKNSSQESIHFELNPGSNYNSNTETDKVKYVTPRSRNMTYSTLHTETKNMTNSTSHSIIALERVQELKQDNVKQFPPKLSPSRSNPVNWTEYPYIAAYIYDRYKVHCDAVVISAHWLMAAGSCLSRHSDDPSGESRSAFVTYCGSTWWNPERITYVKYSIVHPMYNPRDKTRKYLYNIGLIQVVTSMASACPKWEPVILMSYHYIGGDDSVAVAVGWGLDRYGVKYSSSDIPKRPLSVYAGSVYSDSCPGNTGYQKAKEENEEGLNNVYCLALPNYSREDLDPVHGGLLVVGGKFIALFLKEERHTMGDQSAEYTGVWRHLPWVTEVSREPEEADFLSL